MLLYKSLSSMELSFIKLSINDYIITDQSSKTRWFSWNFINHSCVGTYLPKNLKIINSNKIIFRWIEKNLNCRLFIHLSNIYWPLFLKHFLNIFIYIRNTLENIFNLFFQFPIFLFLYLIILSLIRLSRLTKFI